MKPDRLQQDRHIPTDADGRPIRSGPIVRAREKPAGAWQLIPKQDWMQLSQEQKEKYEVLHGETAGGSVGQPPVVTYR